MATVTLTRFRIHDGTDRQTTLRSGNVETVFGDGSGLNFASLDDLRAWLRTPATTEDEQAKQAALLRMERDSPDFTDTRVVGRTLDVPSREASDPTRDTTTERTR